MYKVSWKWDLFRCVSWIFTDGTYKSLHLTRRSKCLQGIKPPLPEQRGEETKKCPKVLDDTRATPTKKNEKNLEQLKWHWKAVNYESASDAANVLGPGEAPHLRFARRILPRVQWLRCSWTSRLLVLGFPNKGSRAPCFSKKGFWGFCALCQ